MNIGSREVFNAKSDDFKILNWIHADGSNIIKTNIFPTANTKVVVDYVAENANSIFMTAPYQSSTADGPSFGTTGTTNGNLKSFRFGLNNGTANNFTRWDVRSVVEFSNIVKVDGTTVKTFSKSSFSTPSKYPIAIFGRSYDNGDRIIGTLYSMKIYENEVLIADFKPALKSGIAGLYDAISEKMFCDLNGHEFTYGQHGNYNMNTDQVIIDKKPVQLMKSVASILPAGYTQLKWLDNSVQSARNAAAYVNTGINSLDGRTSRIEIDACWRYKTVSGLSNWNVLFAAQASDNDSGTIQIRVKGLTTTSAALVSNLNDSNQITVQSETPFHAILDKALFTVDDTTVTTTCGSTVSKGPLHIGKPQWDRGSEFRYWEGLLGRCVVYDNEQLVGDLVPARRAADDVCGYYDIVRDVFLPSANSIPFIEGTIDM